MPRKYPDVLRQTVIDAVTVMGMPQKEAAATYEVGLSTVQRWVESSVAFDRNSIHQFGFS